MIREILRDAAVATAKAYCHDKTEPRHVIFAAARHFRERPGGGAFLQAAKCALEPRGASLGVPAVTSEAESLLDSIFSEEDALAAILSALGPEPKSETGEAARGQFETLREPETSQVDSASAAAPRSTGTTVEILAELEGLIGLASVKAQVRSITSVVWANLERRKAGLATVNPGLHLVFTGPPGTGKSTVARLVARLYGATGALAGANFTEVSRADLVAGYVGQTAIKTAELIAKTRPGVLFIDEAYALMPNHDSDFGAEAIAILVKAMEDHRNDFAVIAAGYSDLMAAFIASNPGLRSRFKTFVDFPNYSADELRRIFEKFAHDSGLGLQSGVLDKAEQLFQRALGKQDFGNARFARSLFEQAYARMASRAAMDGTITVDEVVEIAAEDVEWPDAAFESDRRRIGFGRTDGHRGDPGQGSAP